MSVRRIAALDGLRAIAVSMVVLQHASFTAGFPEVLRHALFFNAGLLGVNIFFVLSGFLITSLLIAESRSSGSVSLRDFYIRRTLRIFPAAYVLIGAVALLNIAGWAVIDAGDLPHALTYTMNYHPVRAWALGHLWSLGVEEQFYLLWPAAFVLLRERGALWLSVVSIAAIPALRVFTWMYLPAARAGIGEEFQTVCDGLSTGCLLGLLIAAHGADELARRVPSLLFWLAPAVVVACSALEKHTTFALPIGSTLSNVGIALIILWCVSHSRTRMVRWLDGPALVFVGMISYSLYLWQQIFMDRTLFGGGIVFPFNVVLAVAFALASYHLVERPLIRRRARFHKADSIVPATQSP